MAIEVHEAMVAVEAAEPVVAVLAVKDSEADAAVVAVEAFEAGAVVERRDHRGSHSVVAGEAVKAVGLIASSTFARRSIHLMRSGRTKRS